MVPWSLVGGGFERRARAPTSTRHSPGSHSPGFADAERRGGGLELVFWSARSTSISCRLQPAGVWNGRYEWERVEQRPTDETHFQSSCGDVAGHAVGACELWRVAKLWPSPVGRRAGEIPKTGRRVVAPSKAAPRQRLHCGPRPPKRDETHFGIRTLRASRADAHIRRR